VVISYGSASNVAQWKQDTKCPFDVYRDPDRRLYNLFGLELSIKRVWGTDTICFYATEKVCGRKLHKMTGDDDPHQMGGDFILDSQGKVVLHYASQTPSDRPSVDLLLAHCK